MIRRVFNAAFSNIIANHPDVRPWLGGEGWLDTAPLIEDRRNYALEGEHGVIFFHQQDRPGVFELHYHFRPAGWGWEPRAALASALGYIFEFIGADLIVVRTAADNPRSRRLIERAGFVHHLNQPGVWPSRGQLVDLATHHLTRAQWAQTV